MVLLLLGTTTVRERNRFCHRVAAAGRARGAGRARRGPAASDRTDGGRLRAVWEEGEVGQVPDAEAFRGRLDLGDPGQRVEDGGTKGSAAVGSTTAGRA